MCKRTFDLLDENLPAVLCIVGGALATVPILGFGPLIAVMFGVAMSVIVLDRFFAFAT